MFDKPPDQPGAKRIEVWTPDMSVTIGEKSTMGRGGMASKISAARCAPPHLPRTTSACLEGAAGFARIHAPITLPASPPARSVAANGGVQTCVASGYDLANISRIFNGENVGTLFPASVRTPPRVHAPPLPSGAFRARSARRATR